MNESRRVERARTAFAEQFPEVMERVRRLDQSAASVIMANGEAVDVVVAEQSIYGGDAPGFSRNQVATFLAKPPRLFMDRPNSAGLVSPICVRLLEAIAKQVTAEGLDSINKHPVDSPTFLIVFGLGLGHHLEELAAKTEARWLILVEPLLQFIEPSFHVVDWSGLLERFKNRGGSVHLVTDIDPAAMVSSIVRVMRQRGIPYTDGTWVFTHYPSWAFSEARKRLHLAVEFTFVNRGFFEDELRMMENAVENFATRSFWLLDGRPRLQRPETAVVVGAGASLDESFDTIRRMRDRIVLFSGGTSLRPLLRNGIVPDFHCELENVPAVYDVLGEAAKFGDLSKVTLVASATVDPRVPPLFGENIFYFRDTVSSTQILSGRYAHIPGTAPTCVNLALMTAAFMGFTNFFLFGTDCGIRPGGDHHARDTVYRDVGLWKDQNKDQNLNARYPMEVEGNFGGIARTDWVYDGCRVMLAEAIGTFRLNARNCSDGALIPGAVPCVPESAEVTGPLVDRAAFWSAIQRSMRRFAAGEVLKEAEFSVVAERATSLLADLDGLLEELERGEPDFANVYGAMMDFIKAGDRYRHTEAIISGTLQALPRIAMFFGFRVADPGIRRRLFVLFIEEFRAIAAQMNEETGALFTRLEDVIARSSHQAMATAE